MNVTTTKRGLFGVRQRRGEKVAEAASVLAEEMTKKDEERWSDQLEAIRFTTQVFSRLHTMIGEDIILAKLDEPTREFIVEQTKLAFALNKQLASEDAEVANRIFLSMIAEVLMISVVNRNVDKNTILEIVGGVYNDKREEEQALAAGEAKPTLIQKIKESVVGKKKEEPA